MSENKSSLKVLVQKVGTALSSMVMPNIGAFIAWGLITALFIPTGWMPNAKLAALVAPMIFFLLPLLISYSAGKNVHDERGGVVAAIATMGVIVGTVTINEKGLNGTPMFLGAMVMGPIAAHLMKKFDKAVQPKIKTGLEMLVNNFSAGILGFILAILGFFGIGPIVKVITNALSAGVDVIINAHLLPLANVFIEPAKILFLNNALNHGIFTPIGTQQVVDAGKSILFLLEANPGPGLGILLAFAFFGKGSAKSSSWGAMLIHFVGGIHEIYFPYVMMKPAMFLAVIAGGVSGTFTFQLLGAGLTSAASPGSIIAILGMAPKGFMPHLVVLAGVLVAAAVSFVVGSFILKLDNSEEASLEAAQAATTAAKAQAKGQAVAASPEFSTISTDSVKRIIFACDAGMGSSAMGASLLRNKIQKAGFENIPVTNQAISTLEDTDYTLIVTQEELAERAAQRTPRAIHVAVDNFLTSPKYDEIVAQLTNGTVSPAETAAPAQEDAAVDLNFVDEVVFPYDKAEGSATMGRETLQSIFRSNDVKIPVVTVPLDKLAEHNAKNILVVTTIAQQSQVQEAAPNAQLLVVDSVVTTPEYDKLIARMHK